MLTLESLEARFAREFSVDLASKQNVLSQLSIRDTTPDEIHKACEVAKRSFTAVRAGDAVQIIEHGDGI